MRRSPALLLVHVVWSTARRRAILPAYFDDALLGIIAGKAQELGCKLVCGGCASDHLHVLVRLTPRVALADLVQKMKGGSAYEANRHALRPEGIYWQDGYWAETLGPADVTPVSRYIVSQRAHHDDSHPAERWQFSS